MPCRQDYATKSKRKSTRKPARKSTRKSPQRKTKRQASKRRASPQRRKSVTSTRKQSPVRSTRRQSPVRSTRNQPLRPQNGRSLEQRFPAIPAPTRVQPSLALPVRSTPRSNGIGQVRLNGNGRVGPIVSPGRATMAYRRR